MDPLVVRFRVYVFLLVAVVAFGTVGLMGVEHFSLVDALYFTVVTVATVGYGDIHPVTSLGKLLTIIIIITGVGTFLGVIANAMEMLLNRREKLHRLQKLHTVSGLFFSEIGTELLEHFGELDPNLEIMRSHLIVTGDWSDGDFKRVEEELKHYEFQIDHPKGKLELLRRFLDTKGTLLLRLLESPYLLEQESFTELLRAVFHLREELLNRGNVEELPETDYAHLAGDIKRVYILLVHHWLDYMKYMKERYPYLFSLAMRTNPFDQSANAVVE